jgi:hypothetical protein
MRWPGRYLRGARGCSELSRHAGVEVPSETPMAYGPDSLDGAALTRVRPSVAPQAGGIWAGMAPVSCALLDYAPLCKTRPGKAPVCVPCAYTWVPATNVATTPAAFEIKRRP